MTKYKKSKYNYKNINFIPSFLKMTVAKKGSLILIEKLKKTYVIGDVHGCYYTLKELLHKLPHNSRIIFVGDVCDRGSYTKRVIDLIIENEYECVLGNHERYMLEYAYEIINGGTNRWLKDSMGGKQTLKSYKNHKRKLFEHIEYIKTLPTYILVDNYFITHGFALPYFARRNKIQSLNGLTKNRISDQKEWGHDWEKGYENYDIINVFGHTPYKEVKKGSNFFGIDTGCVYGGKLSAIELNTQTFIFQKHNPKDVK